jgi:hypothetical protein
MAPITGRSPDVIIWYDKGNTRAFKVFKGTEIVKARRFYAQKLKDGKHPCIKRDDDGKSLPS